MKRSQNGSKYVVCIKNRGYRASLVLRRFYKILPDPQAEQHGLLRVVDESGEDYLYPQSLFMALELPRAAERALAQAT
jgi:hypothetical protein